MPSYANAAGNCSIPWINDDRSNSTITESSITPKDDEKFQNSVIIRVSVDDPDTSESYTIQSLTSTFSTFARLGPDSRSVTPDPTDNTRAIVTFKILVTFQPPLGNWPPNHEGSETFDFSISRNSTIGEYCKIQIHTNPPGRPTPTPTFTPTPTSPPAGNCALRISPQFLPNESTDAIAVITGPSDVLARFLVFGSRHGISLDNKNNGVDWYEIMPEDGIQDTSGEYAMIRKNLGTFAPGGYTATVLDYNAPGYVDPGCSTFSFNSTVPPTPTSGQGTSPSLSCSIGFSPPIVNNTFEKNTEYFALISSTSRPALEELVASSITESAIINMTNTTGSVNFDISSSDIVDERDNAGTIIKSYVKKSIGKLESDKHVIKVVKQYTVFRDKDVCTVEVGIVPTATPFLELKNVCENVQGNLAGPGQKALCEHCLLDGGAYTALGCMPTNLSQFLQKYVFTLGLGMAGGVAFLLMLWGGFLVLSSQGDAQQIGLGREIIIGAVTGLMFIIFSIFILRFIGVDILRIPGFGPKPVDPNAPSCQYIDENSCTSSGNCTNGCSGNGSCWYCTATGGSTGSIPPTPTSTPALTHQVFLPIPVGGTTPTPSPTNNPLPVNTPTLTPAPTTSRPGGLIPTHDTIQPTDLASAMEARAEGGLRNTNITFNAGRISMLGDIEIDTGVWKNFEATVTMRIVDSSFRIDAQSIYIGGFDVSANQQARAKLEETVRFSLNNDLLSQRFLDSYQVVGGNLEVDSHKRP